MDQVKFVEDNMENKTFVYFVSGFCNTIVLFSRLKDFASHKDFNERLYSPFTLLVTIANFINDVVFIF